MGDLPGELELPPEDGAAYLEGSHEFKRKLGRDPRGSCVICYKNNSERRIPLAAFGCRFQSMMLSAAKARTRWSTL